MVRPLGKRPGGRWHPELNQKTSKALQQNHRGGGQQPAPTFTGIRLVHTYGALMVISCMAWWRLWVYGRTSSGQRPFSEATAHASLPVMAGSSTS